MTDVVERMRDIRLPEPDFWWPPAPGWWLLGVLSGMLLLALGLFIRRRRRLRRLALAELEGIRERFHRDGDRRALAMALNMLLRRVALARHDRHSVAPLRGEAWLEFLDTTGHTRHFARGIGRALLQAPYRPDTGFDERSLLELVEKWIREVT